MSNSSPSLSPSPSPSPSSKPSSLVFLRSFEIYDVGPAGAVIAITDRTDFKSFAMEVAATGQPMVVVDKERLAVDVAALLVFPVYKSGMVTSVVVFAASNSPDAIGVFEVWEPTGSFDDVKLTLGYYPKLERFQNVSSFVRFEKGIGLPGQVWHRHRAVVHDDLPNHPGFLRAAGASAESLTTGIGIPVFDDDYVASIVLISSKKTPMARGFEVWIPDADGFTLLEGAYPDVGPEYSLLPKTKLRADEGLPGQAASHGGACVSMNPAVFAARRQLAAGGAKIHSGIAIPHYEGSVLTSVIVMLF